MTKRTFKQTCYFCKKSLPPGAKRKYIYPLPSKYKPNLQDGAYSCDKCYPDVLAEQQAEGQMLREAKMK